MIKNIRHKGLDAFHHSGRTAGIQARHAKRLRLILSRLDVSFEPKDMNLPGLRLHKLSQNRKDYYAVTVQANWRIVFRFEGNHVYDVDYVDYH